MKRSAELLLLALHVLNFYPVKAQHEQQSPCKDVFTYQLDPVTGQIYGYIEVRDIHVGQEAQLRVDLSIPTQLPPNNVGSITLIKSETETFNDILRGYPAQYRVNFPLQHYIPSVLSISLNGHILCTGYRTQGRIMTIINLEHNLRIRLAGQNVPFAPNSVPYKRPDQTTQVHYQPKPAFPEPIVPAPSPPQIRTTTPRPRPVVIQPQTTSLPVQFSTASNGASSNRVCGKPAKSSFSKLSFNGQVAGKGQFPWAVPLFERIDDADPEYLCGSTIITRKHLITAASCVYKTKSLMKPDQIFAIPGLYNLDDAADENAAGIDAIIPHSDYVPEGNLGDTNIAVLRLRRNLQFSDYILPVCLWDGENGLQQIVGEDGIMVGWGVTETGPTTVPTFVKQTIVEPRQCIESWSRIFSSSARVFCGDGSGSAPCFGDAGSALVMRKDNRFYLRGILSTTQVDTNTLKCDVTKYALYTDIADFPFWLNDVAN
ncbi:serine protease gd-like [Wyeomyia smithii]|uniref:serine protease gd-like n=1 Tax=Wyeomyia smithii TaxID=174621 RepID=UPI002467C484|nr:serine protease gd-like [Wyeomyia smithii]